MDLGIIYELDTSIWLEGYTDVDCAGYKADRLSTSGFVFSLANKAISWSSTHELSISKCTITSFASAVKLTISIYFTSTGTFRLPISSQKP